MKKIVREFEFTAEELSAIRGYAASLGITETTARLLYARGMTTEGKMRAFLNPSREHFLSPFLMKGMK